MFQEADVNKDGVLDISEFGRMVTRSLELSVYHVQNPRGYSPAVEEFQEPDQEHETQLRYRRAEEVHEPKDGAELPVAKQEI